MSKELYIAAHEELIDEIMEETGCAWEQAYEAAADGAYDRMVDRLGDMADAAHDRMKGHGE